MYSLENVAFNNTYVAVNTLYNCPNIKSVSINKGKFGVSVSGTSYTVGLAVLFGASDAVNTQYSDAFVVMSAHDSYDDFDTRVPISLETLILNCFDFPVEFHHTGLKTLELKGDIMFYEKENMFSDCTSLEKVIIDTLTTVNITCRYFIPWKG